MNPPTVRTTLTRLALLLAVLAGGALVAWSLSAGEGQPNKVTNSLGMEFVRIPAGNFVMGSPAAEQHRGSDEMQHAVTISKPFFLGVHEVTQAQYEKVIGSNPSFFTATGGGKQRIGKLDTANNPVEMVSWNDAALFCKKLGELAGEKGRTYRLPTEAEWEYACRAGTRTALHYGDKVDAYSANFNGLAPYGDAGGGPFFRRTTRVGEYKANAWGLLDMHANVQEWCQDWYGADYYQNSPKTDPPGPKEGTERVLRGGAWPHSAKACRSAVRAKQEPDHKSYSTGFRVVLVEGK